MSISGAINKYLALTPEQRAQARKDDGSVTISSEELLLLNATVLSALTHMLEAISEIPSQTDESTASAQQALKDMRLVADLMIAMGGDVTGVDFLAIVYFANTYFRRD